MESITKDHRPSASGRFMLPRRRIGIILVWMGKLPSYFPLWQRSLEKNKAFDFFLFTDQRVETDRPDNLKIIPFSFGELRALISDQLLLKVNIPYAYKLTDFKPAYGEIFSDYLTDYDNWGCCDMDLLFGNLSKFVTEDLLASYRKIFSRGHLTIYRNDPTVNATYRLSRSLDYKKILTSPESFLFDEWYGIHRIFEELGMEQYNREVMADIKVLHPRITTTNLRNFTPQVFAWEEGAVRQYYIEDGNLKDNELAYVHFQKRKIRLPDPAVLTSKAIILQPRALLPFSDRFTSLTVREYDRPDFAHYINAQAKRIRRHLSSFNKESLSINKTLTDKTVSSKVTNA